MEEGTDNQYKGLKQFYFKKYKILLIIPFLLLALAIAQIAIHTATTGDFINKGIELRGGISVRVNSLYSDIPSLEEFLHQEFPGHDLHIRIVTAAGKQKAFIVEAPKEIGHQNLLNAIEEKIGDLGSPEPSLKEVSSAFGAGFFKTTIIAVIVAFCLMAFVVFLYFRIPVPSIAVVLAAFSDIIVTIAIFNLLGFKLAPGGIAAFLMLIGYSVDTDILLATRVIKHGTGTIFERVCGAMRTGLVMSITTIAAITVALIFAQSEILKQIMTVLLIGLIIDLSMTWFQNAGLLRLYYAKKGRI